METKVVVIDDEESIRKTIVRIVGRLGCQVSQAVNGEEGIRLIKDEQPVLVITDFEMPKMGGEEVVRYIRAKSWPIKTLVLSGSLNPEVRDAALAAGCDLFMQKPFELPELIETVKRLLSDTDRFLPRR